MIRGIVFLAAVLALGLSTADARPAYARCPTGPNLKGKLFEQNARCSTAQRVSYGYFSHTQPGQHEGPATVYHFQCDGHYARGAFHIKCHRGIPGQVGKRRTRFVGVAQ